MRPKTKRAAYRGAAECQSVKTKRCPRAGIRNERNVRCQFFRLGKFFLVKLTLVKFKESKRHEIVVFTTHDMTRIVG